MFNEFETKLTPESNWELKYIHIFKGIYIAPSENEYKKGNKMHLHEENEFAIEEKTADEMTYFILHIKSKKYHIMIRSNSRISLEYIIFHSTLTEDRDIGRPLTFYPHLSNIDSPLEEKRLKENNYRGFINLLIIALVLSHVRLMYENYIKYGILITPQNIFKFVTEHDNFIFLSATILLLSFAVIFTFILEKAASKSKANTPILILHGLNLITLLTVPLLFHKFNLINPCKNNHIITIYFYSNWSSCLVFCDCDFPQIVLLHSLLVGCTTLHQE